MADLKIDGPSLDALIADLTSVKSTFDQAEALSSDIASYVGESHLEHKVQEFATAWNLRRHDVSESLTGIHASAVKVRDEFSGADTGLANILSGKK